MNKKDLLLRNKLFPSGSGKIGPSEFIDTVKDGGSLRKADRVLLDSFAAWNALDKFRAEADKNKMYVFGDQWGDRINYNGRTMTERESIRQQGNQPITNNRLRSAMRTIIGLFQSNQTEPVCIAREREGQEKGEVMTATLQYVYQLNKLWNLDVSTLNNLLISGLAMFRSEYGMKNGRIDVWTDALNYGRVFFDNHMEDVRQWDCHLIGELSDMSIYDVMARFADGSPAKAERIRNIYSSVNVDRTSSNQQAYTRDKKGDRNFYIADDDTLCRVITTWRKEAKERYLVHDALTGDYYKVETSDLNKLVATNQQRIMEQQDMGVLPDDMKLLDYKWFVDNYWYFYHQAPTGEVLSEGESPYWHEGHPYSFKLYTFYDGQVFPFISGFIDQQRYINRLIMMQDFIMRASAKGVLMIPEECLPTGMTPEQFADNWVKFNGVIVYTASKSGAVPKQVTANSTQLGVYDMLSMQLKMFEDISGVQGALQGQSPGSGTPAALYAQQTQNATTSLAEVFDMYRMLREERDTKNLQLIQQFYDTPKLINTSGDSRKMVTYDPKMVQNTLFDLSIVESTSTPVYRMVINDMLMNLLNSGHITIKEMLENGSLPFADKLLQAINMREQQMQGMEQGGTVDPASLGQMPQLQSIPDELKSQIVSRANPMINRFLGE